MADHTGVDWNTCTDDDCIGVRLPTGGRCWAHAADSDLDAALKQLSADGELDARGVTITDELLNRMLEAAPHNDHKAAILTAANFRMATFQGEATRLRGTTFQSTARFGGTTFRDHADFGETTFQGEAEFSGATFQGGVWFDQATFQRQAGFDLATFHRWARFDRSTFQDHAGFGGVTIQDHADFSKATFRDHATFNDATFEARTNFAEATFQSRVWFSKVTFNDGATFRRATFQSRVWFREATFASPARAAATSPDREAAWFGEATFQDYVDFGGAAFEGSAVFDEATFHAPVGLERTTIREANFSNATFRQARSLGPTRVHGSLVLDGATFQERVLIEVSAEAVSCRRTRFPAGVQLRIRWADVAMDDADLAAPSIISGGHHLTNFDEDTQVQAMHRLSDRPRRDGTPRLVSLRRADVAGLTVARIDMRACRFAGAHHLDQLRVGPAADLALTPKGRWTTRKAIAEEHHWRALHHPDSGWHGPAEQPPAWLDNDDDGPAQPAQIAEIYRSLRKAREDNKDEPGAADFYYGEMEMRRHNPAGPRAERFILLLYWLFSGYALRASRAFAWLLGVLIAATVLLAATGLERSDTTTNWSFAARLGTAALVAVEGAVVRATEQDLTYTGRVVQVATRIAGPILLGLAAISIRGRVKR